MIFGGALAGAIVAAIVGVHTVSDVGEPKLCAESLHAFEKLGLAMKAAIGVVTLVFRIVEFRGLDNSKRDTLRFSECSGLFHVTSGEAGRIGQDSKHAIAEYTMGYGGEKSGIDASGIGNHHRAERTQTIFERSQLCGCPR